MTFPLVIINDLDVSHVLAGKSKTNPPLIVNTNTPLAAPVSYKSFESIPRRHSQLLNPIHSVEHRKLT
jgi:hypothetical protein